MAAERPTISASMPRCEASCSVQRTHLQHQAALFGRALHHGHDALGLEAGFSMKS
jgi:hypothetical protein